MGSGTVAGFIASRIGHGDTSVNDQDHFAEVEFGQEQHHEAEHEESKVVENSGTIHPEPIKVKE